MAEHHTGLHMHCCKEAWRSDMLSPAGNKPQHTQCSVHSMRPSAAEKASMWYLCEG